MEHEHVIGGLLSKRADIAGAIAALHDQLRAEQAAVANVEATIRLFQPDVDFSCSRVSRKPGALPAAFGDMAKAVRDVLRQSAEPLTGSR